MRASQLSLLLALTACSETHRNLVSDPTSSYGGPRKDSGTPTSNDVLIRNDSGAPPAADSGKALQLDATTAYCGDRACSCDDGVDNDRDGLSDGLDPECTGAFDDDEASFATGRPTQHNPCRDCYWDANNGGGDDGCRYPAQCLTDPDFSEKGKGKGNCGSCSVNVTCESYCKARTPSGCDCFGCCAVAAPSGELIHIQLVDSCTLAKSGDLTACPRCTPHASCKNDCARCELCLGKQLADLPSDCRAGTGPGYVCDDGVARCSSTSPCKDGFYCHQGCCLVDLL